MKARTASARALDAAPALGEDHRAVARELSKLRRKRRLENLGGIISNELIVLELARFLETAFPGGGDALLDVGAGTRPYAALYEPRFRTSLSTDVEQSLHDISSVDVLAAAGDLPFENERFDCVVCTEVLEHCPDPWAAGAEIGRVLRPGGWAFVSTPFLRPLHEAPHDYHRFTPWGLAELAQRSELTVERIAPRGDYVAVTLMTLLLPISKFWLLLSRWLGVNMYRPTNPLVWASIVAPQRAYVEAWSTARRRKGWMQKLSRRLEYYTLGYVMWARKPGAFSARRRVRETRGDTSS
jgi:SAM-dependent methyltransferase